RRHHSAASPELVLSRGRGSTGAARGRAAGPVRYACGCHASRRGRGRAAQDPAGARRGGRAETPCGRPAAGELQDAAAEDQGLRDRALAAAVSCPLPAVSCPLSTTPITLRIPLVRGLPPVPPPSRRRQSPTARCRWPARSAAG